MLIPGPLTSFPRFLLTLPLRVVVGIPVTVLVCLFGSMEVGGIKVAEVTNPIGYAATFVLRLFFAVPLFAFTLVVGDIRVRD